MQALHYNTVLSQEGVLTLHNLPFHRGDRVEVVLRECRVPVQTSQPFPLKGKVVRFDKPTEATGEVWESAK